MKYLKYPWFSSPGLFVVNKAEVAGLSHKRGRKICGGFASVLLFFWDKYTIWGSPKLGYARCLHPPFFKSHFCDDCDNLCVLGQTLILCSAHTHTNYVFRNIGHFVTQSYETLVNFVNKTMVYIIEVIQKFHNRNYPFAEIEEKICVGFERWVTQELP